MTMAAPRRPFTPASKRKLPWAVARRGPPAIEAAACKQARKLLGWSRLRTTVLAGVSEHLVARIEAGIFVTPAKASAARTSSEVGGVQFFRGSCGEQGIERRKDAL